MGHPKGFLKYERELPDEVDCLERLKNWNEFHRDMPQDKLKRQGARCMDCGVPFCHAGILINGLTSGCPINNLIPEWNDLVYRELWKQAYERLIKTNNFPEFTGRVCPAPCEGSCVLGAEQPPVAIKAIENAIIERAFAEGWVQSSSPRRRTGKKVAVVGSGPAGLACAAQLNSVGHSVTVYERADRPGGLLMYGIPNMKLDKHSVVMRRIKLMEAEGVEFVLNTEVGRHITARDLINNYSAVVLCCGATKPRDLPIEGRTLQGIHFAMDFLKSNTKSLLDSNHADGQYISAKDKHVIVIGGGDTGVDCVATALRQGCKAITQLEILPMPSLERTKDNPWPQWPKTLKADYGHEEAIAQFGDDPRQFSVSTIKFISEGDWKVSKLLTIKVEWKNENGALKPIPLPGTERELKADLVLLALGFTGPEELLLDQLGVERTPQSTVKAEHGKFQTSLPTVFAAGDMRRGQSLVVWAINEGRGAAKAVDAFLMGTTQLP